ncbi:MAG: hypothetical protein IPF53_19115 [Blastocatellia bacterium]|nr:hypothetical protein [Blastocatellia bacterium]
MRSVLLALCLAIPWSGSAAVVPYPAEVRVGVLGLLAPQRVEVTSVSELRSTSGHTFAAGRRVVIEVDRESLRFGGPSRNRWRGRSISVGARGERISVVVHGRNVRRRLLPAPVEFSLRGNRVVLVATFALEDLVASAVAAELAGVTETAALEATAIAIRSYIATSRARHDDEGFDVCDSTHCVHSAGLVEAGSGSDAAAVSAASMTRERVLARAGHVVTGYVTSCCGGETTTPSRTWGGKDLGDFVPVACRVCSGRSTCSWERTVPATSIASAIADAFGKPVPSDFTLRTRPDDGLAVRTVTIVAGAREWTVYRDAFRMAIGRRLGWDTLPSSNYEWTTERRRYRFRGSGRGHGIGLCMMGAVELSIAGRTREEILLAYFPRAIIELLPRPSGGV